MRVARRQRKTMSGTSMKSGFVAKAEWERREDLTRGQSRGKDLELLGQDGFGLKANLACCLRIIARFYCARGQAET